MRHLIVAVTLLATIATARAAPACPGDTVVWVNQNTGVYHLPGDRWYGRTKHGAYACERQAEAEGDHRSGIRVARQHTPRSTRRSTTRSPHTVDEQMQDAQPESIVKNPF